MAESGGSAETMTNRDVDGRDTTDLPLRVNKEGHKAAAPDSSPTRHLDGVDAVELGNLLLPSQPISGRAFIDILNCESE
jgi:hypothetical protein